MSGYGPKAATIQTVVNPERLLRCCYTIARCICICYVLQVCYLCSYQGVLSLGRLLTNCGLLLIIDYMITIVVSNII